MSFLRLFLLMGMLLLAGCSGQTVRHLPSNLWKTEQPQKLQMRYLSFEYQVVRMEDGLGIVAEAYPVISRLPDWASWYGEISLSIYVADEQGKVLASQDTVLVPRPLQREASLPIEARFDLGTNSQQPLFVSFGYRLVLTDTVPTSSSARRTLITESALEE